MRNKKCPSPTRLILDTLLRDRKPLKPIFGIFELELGFLQSRPLEILFLMVPPILKLVALALRYFSHDLRNRFQIFTGLPVTQTLRIIKKDYKVKSQLKSSNFFLFTSPLQTQQRLNKFGSNYSISNVAQMNFAVPPSVGKMLKIRNCFGLWHQLLPKSNLSFFYFCFL